MYLVKTPRLIKALMPAYIWQMPDSGNKIYLTFDDGPIPDVTPWVLKVLDEYRARATFFCVGDNIRKHPAVLDELMAQGHVAGNHTFNHLNGWQTDNVTYFHNVRRCARLVNSDLFRPPYGRITPAQRAFLERHYRIIMWDVLSGDFDPSISPKQCLHNVLQYTEAGSIVVMHDSLKAEKKIRYVLPRLLDHFAGLGYRFEAIPPAVEKTPASRPVLSGARSEQ